MNNTHSASDCEAGPSTSLQETHVAPMFEDISFSNSIAEFDPETVSPIPVAPSRKAKTRGNRRRTAVITDTPVRNALFIDEENSKL